VVTLEATVEEGDPCSGLKNVMLKPFDFEYFTSLLINAISRCF
jgi:hypothetical protein